MNASEMFAYLCGRASKRQRDSVKTTFSRKDDASGKKFGVRLIGNAADDDLAEALLLAERQLPGEVKLTASGNVGNVGGKKNVANSGATKDEIAFFISGIVYGETPAPLAEETAEPEGETAEEFYAKHAIPNDRMEEVPNVRKGRKPKKIETNGEHAPEVTAS